MAAIPYRAEVDGLRAVAILAVLFFHIFPEAVPGGFAGVDVFFVISGYLIASIIRRECEAKVFRLRKFYGRRVRRLFPAFCGMLVGVLAVGWYMDPLHLERLKNSARWALLVAGNLYMLRTRGDYWAGNYEQHPLLHTWSLAIEEQFYLVFPVVALVLYRWRPKWVFPVLAGVTLGGFLLGVVMTRWVPTSAFYLLPPRGWELALGCLLAAHPTLDSKSLSRHRLAHWLAWLGLGMILGSFWLIRGGHEFPGYRAALPTVGALLVIAFTDGGDGGVARLLRAPFSVFVGKISYSLYLWHWPMSVFLLGMAENPTAPRWLEWEWIRWVCVLVSFVAALASYFLIERPFKDWRWTPQLAGAAFAGLFLVIGLPSLQGRGSQLPLTASSFASQVSRGRLYSVNQNVGLSDGQRRKFGRVRIETPGQPNPLLQGVLREYHPGHLDVLILGDSHSLMFAPLLDELCRNRRWNVQFFCVEGVAPDLFRGRYFPTEGLGGTEEMRAFDQARRQVIETKSPRVVVWIQRYDERRFDEVRASLEFVLERAACVFVQQAPVLNIGDLYSAMDAFTYYRDVARLAPDQLRIIEKQAVRRRRDAFEGALRSRFQDQPRFHFVDTLPKLLAEDGRIRWSDGRDQLYYLDDDHLSEEGVRVILPAVEAAIARSLDQERGGRP